MKSQRNHKNTAALINKTLIRHFIFFALIAFQPAYSQSVGVVLSGGGPRGVAHIGVLKALEENDIPIDYITGTSMGAIIGGLYAIGYSPDEIRDFISSPKMGNWIDGETDQQFIYSFKQSFPNASWQIFKITYDSVLRARLPANIVSPYEMDFGFLEAFAKSGAAAGYDFDSLYIPFRCVASDIIDSRPLIMRNGHLDKSIRASMTFPFYFKPIKINERILFDGGMYNNFPVDVLQEEFNPDIVIGSKAASNYNLLDSEDIISLMQSMLMTNTRYAVDPDHGILIEPEMWSVGISDFSNTSGFIDSGYVAAIRRMGDIKALIERSETKAEKNEKREAFQNKTPPLMVKNIVIKGVNDNQQAYVKKLINSKKILQKINEPGLSDKEKLNILKKSYYFILSEKHIDYVNAELQYDSVSKTYDFILDLKKSNRLVLELGGLVSSKAINEIFFQAEYNRWGNNSLNLLGNAYLGRFHNSGYLGARFDFPFLIPLSIEPAYTLNSWNFFKTNTYFFEDENPGFLIQQDNFWSIDVSTPVSRIGKLSGQIQAGRKKDEYYQSNYFTRLDTNDVTTFEFSSPALLFEMNSLNRKQYASDGMLLRLSGRLISGWEKTIPGSTSIEKDTLTKHHQWIQLQLKYDHYFARLGKARLGFYGEASLSNQEVFSNYTATILSATGFTPLPESQAIFLPQFRAFNYAGIGLKSIFPVIKNMDFRAEGYVFQPFREIKKTETNEARLGQDLATRYYIVSGRFIYHAPFGPISASLDYYDSSDEPIVFNINIGYYIFNRRPFY
jgi:NTE family protein